MIANFTACCRTTSLAPRAAQFCAVLLVLLQLGALPARAEIWAEPGDIGLRSDLQLLADYGVIRAPGQTWPRPWPEIAKAVEDAGTDGLPEHVLAALARVRFRAGEASRTEGLDIRASLAVAQSPTKLRTFDDRPREAVEGSFSVAGMGEYTAGKLRVTGVLRTRRRQASAP